MFFDASDCVPLSRPGPVSAVPPREIAFVLLPDFSMIAFSAALEPLRMANRLSGRELYRWRILSPDGAAVTASNGLQLTTAGGLEDIRADLLLVCGGLAVRDHATRPLLQWLQRQARNGAALGGLCTGAYLLARAGLLRGYRCTIHWEHLAALGEEFDGLLVSPELFEIDRNRYTASGGTAPLDMMLNLIGRQHNKALASAISEVFTCERIRGRHDRQRIPLRLRLGTAQPRLVEAVSLMEANIEEPMSPDELARHVGLSRRQLERLFQRYLSTVPTRYYLELRLGRARQLLLQTDRPILEVALACGFASAPHFSKCYRDFFGLPPRDERRRGSRQETAPQETAPA